jgi:nitrate/nitrite-specific signal transduction histidine kinase
MGHSIRGRLLLAIIGLAIGPVLVVGIIFAGLSYNPVQPQALGVQQETALTLTNIVIVTLILVVVAAGIAGAIGLLITRRIVQPIQALTETAEALSAGDLASRALIPSDDEIGILAGTINNMARQLRDRIGTLEHRVADRTKTLATFSEVSRLASMLDEKQLAAEVVGRIQDAFHYYYAQILLFDKSGENLILAGGTGEIGQTLLADGYAIPKAEGAVGRAAETNTPVLIGDTSRDPNRQMNPLLSKARSEVAVPIAVGDQVLGVLDVQQNVVNGLTQADADLLQSIASQVAIAVRHSRSSLQIRQQADREALIASINRKIQETTTVENALRIAVCELGRALGSREMRVVLTESPPDSPVDDESKSGGGK